MKNRHIHRGLIYSITNIKTGHIYIGATGLRKDGKNRFRERNRSAKASQIASDLIKL